jgi:glycosyltransferase involved in cell wall biosynthesis
MVDEPALTTAMELVTRLLEIGSTSAEGKRLSAELRLLNRPPVRDRSLLHDVYHSAAGPRSPRSPRGAGPGRHHSRHDSVSASRVTEDRFIEHHRAISRASIVSTGLSAPRTKADVCGMTAMSSDRVFSPLAAAPEIFHPEPDPERIAPVLAKYGIGTRPYVLSLCTLEPRKNLTRLVRAFFALIEDQRWPDLLLVLVGPTGWKAEGLFASLAERSRERHRVVLTGFVPDEDLSALYSGAQVVVFPSLYEGFGLPALEAMQCGVPVITSLTSSPLVLVGQDAKPWTPRRRCAGPGHPRHPARPRRSPGISGGCRAREPVHMGAHGGDHDAYRTILAASS